MKHNFVLAQVIFCALVLFGCKKENGLENPVIPVDPNADLLKVIWSKKGVHSAFTDLTQFENQFYCAFREGSSHTSYDGIFRILISPDGLSWNTIGTVSVPYLDLRDPKFFVDNEGKLSLAGFARDTLDKKYNFVWKLNKTGIGKPHSVGITDYWLWRYTKFKNINYSIGYLYKKGSSQKPKLVLFFSSDSGFLRYEVKGADIFNKGCPSEASLVINEDSVAYVCLRDDCANGAYFGKSKYPFAKWDWTKLQYPVRGPNMVLLPNGNLILAAGSMKNYYKSYLTEFDPRNLTFKSFEELPSGGDTGYPGLVLRDSVLWVSYYTQTNDQMQIVIKRKKIVM
ncbi:hypothetical protein [Chitinophaga sp. OAE865]|uniref:hypothetical protein n=1 Tax=Chitinophaga sp. OAE865 TaxID=2817898 RepID=UPI001AE137A4